MLKRAFGSLAVAALALSACGGGGDNGRSAANTAQSREVGADDAQGGQLNSGMDPALVPDNTSGEPVSDAAAEPR